jgi:cytochrome c-type biogenesis protein CcmH/NrfG
MIERRDNEKLDEHEQAKRKFGQMQARVFIEATQNLGTEHIHRLSMVGDFSLDPQEEQTLRESLRKKSKDPYGWWLLGHTLLKREEFEEAALCLKKSIKQYKQASYVWRDIGILHKRTGNVSKARNALKKAIELESPMVDPEALYEMAGIMMYDENYTGALELLSIQKTHTPEDPEMWKHIGHCLMRLSRRDDAIKVYKWIVSEKPMDVEAWRHLGYLYSLQQEWEHAEKSLRRANKLSPDDYETSMNFGGLFHTTGRSKSAVKSYRKATKLEPNNPRPWLALGTVFQEIREFDKSHSAFARALELDPDSEIAAAGMLDTERTRRSQPR